MSPRPCSVHLYFDGCWQVLVLSQASSRRYRPRSSSFYRLLEVIALALGLSGFPSVIQTRCGLLLHWREL